MKRQSALVFCVVLACAVLAVASGTETCIVTGKVTDAAGKPVAGAVLEFVGSETGIRYSTKTDKTGFYKQTQFPVSKLVTVTPSKPPWKFKPTKKNVFVRSTGSTADFKAFQ